MPNHHSEKNLLKKTAKLEKELAANKHELRIEAALEEVRRIAMKMNKPAHLLDICETLYKQLLSLGFVEMRNAMINIHNDAGQSFINYDYSDRLGKSTNHLTYDIHPLIEKQIKKIRSTHDAFSETYFTGKDLAQWKKFRKRIGEKDDPRLKNNKGLYYYLYSIGTGSIGISTFGAIGKEKKAVLKRFSNVFQLSYQRHVDIAKAEAQAREAKIEVALERVRARTLAMQKSDELKETTLVLFQQFKSLGATTAQVSICVFDEDTKMGEMFVTLKGEKIDRSFPMELDKEVFVMKKAKKAFLDRQKKFSFTVGGKELQNYNHWRNTLIGKKGWDESDAVRRQSWYVNGVFFSRGLMGVSSDTPPTPEALKLLDRFASLFDLTFTRFLDLQKAEAQAREAQIEASLERVRAKGLAMHSSSELVEASDTMFLELQKLKINTIRVGIGIIDKANDSVEIWSRFEINKKIENKILGIVPANVHTVFDNMIYGRKGNRQFTSLTLKGTEVKKFYKKLAGHLSYPEQEKFNKTETIASFFFPEGSLNVVSHDSLKDDECTIMTRFSRVFGQVYRRFLDLQKAEAQAREAQIEAALEKIRSTSLAMHHANELENVVTILFVQLSELGLSFSGAGIFLFDQREKKIQHWIKGLNLTPVKNILPYDEEFEKNPIVKDLWSAIEKGEHIFNKTYAKSVKDNFFQYTSKYNDDSRIPAAVKKFILQAENFTLTYAAAGNSLVGLDNWSGPFASEEDLQILGRFAKVFDQAYVRFLDLQKAEAQAREAQIEAALERVRARSMAMHHSSELHAAADVLFQQLRHFGGNVMNGGIALCTQDADEDEYWLSSESGLRPVISIPHTEDPIQKKLYEDWKNKSEFYSISKEGDELKAHYNYMQSVPSLKPFFEEGPDWSFPTWQKWHAAYFSHGYLFMITLEPYEEEKILVRFAKVFEQAYTRFLDLQKAEAQAREAQIELALERVRARTMAMQKSDELAEAAQLLYHEFGTLGINTITCGYMFIDEERNIQTAWTALPDGTLLPNFIDFPLTGDHVLNKRYEDWKQKKPLHIFEIQGEVNKEHHKFLSDYVPAFVVKDIFSKLPDKIVFHCANFSNGYLLILATDYFSPDDQQTIIRFAKVFEMTYRRFLDLKQAEAQVRESQIQLALERVRARTMAMHKSVELAETAQVLFHQLRELGGIPDRIAIGVADELEGVVNFWSTDQSGSHIDKSFKARLNERTVMSKTYQAWKENKKSLVIDLHGDDVKEWIQFAREEMGVVVKDEFIKDRRVHNFVFFSHGWILATTHEPQSAETIQILERFASVFSLTYRRFLDLQKAEAQAREAHIEAALERVRSRSLAMHKSDELSVIAKTMFEQLRGLGLELEDGLIIMLFREDSHDQLQWPVLEGLEMDAMFIVPYLDHPVMNEVYKARETGVKFIERHFGKTVKDDFLEKIFSITDYKVVPIEFQKKNFAGSCYHYSFAMEKFTGILMHSYNRESYPAEYNDILRRFARVFEQSYIRFLDLQKAESNAREAQIETSLERVRSKTMAMHNSNDVGETVATMFAEFVYLGIHTNRCGILIFNDQYIAEVWTARSTPGGNAKLIIGKLDLDAHKMLRSLYNAWNAKETFYQYDLLDDDLVQYYTAINNLKFYPTQFDLNALPSKEFHSDFFFADGAVFSFTNEPVIEAHSKIMNRFASVFGQTYRRYLDLQKAEAQAREAKIEAALEKVRSRSLAMHKSQEIQEVINEVFIRLRELEINLDSANILIFENGSKDTVCWTGSTASNSTSSLLRYADIDFLKDMISAKEDQLELFTRQYSREQKNEFFNYVYETTALKETPRDRKQFILEAPCHTVSVAFSKNIAINLNSYSRESFTESENNIVKRFSKVFEQSYTRFLDLQKAEAQAREAQIEVALERVRAKAMAMHDSDDLNETIKVFYQQISLLSLKPRRCGVGLFNNENRMAEVSVMNTTEQGESIDTIGKMELAGHPVLEAIYENWLSQQDYFPILRGNQIKEYYQLLRPHLNYPDYPHDAVQYGYFFYFKEGALYAWTTEELSEEELKIYRRFNSVLSLTYKRYKDLKQAEKNAREAQIEAGLERVRARTMAMFKSDELAETAVVVFKQMKGLGIIPNRLYIVIINDDSGNMEFWITDENGDKIGSRHVVNVNKNISLKTMYDGWADKKKTIIIDQQGNELQDWLSYWKENFGVSFKDDTTIKRRVQTIAYFSRGFIAIASPGDEPRSTINLLERFAAVFNLTYTRFNDLQIAEAQAIEAQIEAGLERVRARTMAMHNSEDVSAATATMFTELEKLGVENLRCGITIIHKNKTQEVWSVSNIMSDVNGNSVEKKNVLAAGTFDMNAHPLWQLIYEKWNNKEDFIQYYLAGKDKEDYFKILNTTKDYLPQAIQQFPDTNFQVYLFGEGAVWSVSLQPHSEEHKQIMKRFTSVFSLTFRRYQDLKKAEAQAREATIEAALEKVRGKAMAMHNSNDLSVTASMVFTELRKLGISPIRCGVGLLNKESRKAQLYSATSSADGDGLSLVGWVILSKHPVLEKIYESWLDNEEYYPELQGEQMRSYYQLLLQGLPVATPKIEDDKKQYGHFLPFSVGCLYAWSEAPYNETEIKILKRFATIIDLTFRRYMELQTSETNAREAVKQAALDRIRADIASMRTIADLDRITPLIWNELTILGIPFIRCGVFIMDESQKLIHTFLSTPDGKAIGAFHLPYDTPGSFSVMLKHWLDKKVYISQWGEVDFIAIAEILLQQGSIVSKEQYLNSLPKGGFYLHFLPFLQGMLYVGNTTQLGEEEIELIQHVSDAFSTAYARYEDFNKLEAAKQQVEKTLTDLKQAQTQLVQSEKMASLGELTAGIAHEIQNPLNFVNNFSDVSNELLEEMKDELAKGNISDAIAIAEDVKQNLEKINHHGKRADGIVKGMLQHSRTSSGQKEMTDINVLADEYLRLAYHGLRAKDKSFNAKFETDFDDKVGRINIIPQEIGRVILNLINNAFYAVSERQKAEGKRRKVEEHGLHPMPLTLHQNYEPTVSIITRKINDKIEIKVSDNGNGIPKNIVDKIFQPFFTTKPTGQGTGLGLSLAYDIVKAHGGELKVQTKEGKGSEFVIQLPVV